MQRQLNPFNFPKVGEIVSQLFTTLPGAEREELRRGVVVFVNEKARWYQVQIEVENGGKLSECFSIQEYANKFNYGTYTPRPTNSVGVFGPRRKPRPVSLPVLPVTA
jgi:hypothetical protein